MDIQVGQGPVPDLAIRGRNLSPSVNLSRESSLASSGCSTPYHDRMDTDVDFPPSREVLNLELSYETEQEKAQWVGMAANQQDNMRSLHIHNEAPPTHSQHEEEVINIQLPYNPQAPTEPDLWSGSFHSISLHSSIEHFVSDSKSIKVSLDFLAKYIRNKQVNSNMINDLADFNGMSDAIWNFISSVYDAKWDALYTDNKANTLRAKVSSKFTPRTIPQHNGNKKDIAKSVPVTINKVLSPPPLPAKTRKEINIISKYFHPKKSLVENTAKGNNASPRKSYAQVSKPPVSTSDVLKIKETFPSLNVQKIDQVNSIVNGQNNPRPRIRMTTKGPSRKQVIIPMSGENISSFMKNSSLHVANINRNLQNAKSDILVDYLHLENSSITVITNKVAQQSDMSIIDNYVKNSNDINSLQVDEPRLPKSKSYLKITGIPFFPYSNSLERLTSDDIEAILKQNHIFDNISLTSKLRVIKVSPKSNMSIVWIDIWDV